MDLTNGCQKWFLYSQCVVSRVHIAIAAMFIHCCVCTYVLYVYALACPFSSFVPIQRRKGRIATKSAKLVKKLNEQVCGSNGSGSCDLLRLCQPLPLASLSPSTFSLSLPCTLPPPYPTVPLSVSSLLSTGWLSPVFLYGSLPLLAR